jgi:hypothetical protein
MFYIFRLKELNEAQQFRFKTAFLVAVYIIILMPIVKKYQGVFFTTQLITVLIIIQQLANKFLEKINKHLIIGQIFHILIVFQGIEILVLLLYFVNFKLMIYIFSIFDICIGLIATSYGIKLTSLQAKLNPKEVKHVQIFKQNIWAEGFLTGLFISFLLQEIGITFTIISAIIIRMLIFIYMIKNWNFFDRFFQKIGKI